MHRRCGGVAVVAAVLSMSATAVAASPTAAGTLPTVNVALTGKAVTAPASVPAGAVTLSVTTKGEKAGTLAIVHLNPGVTIAKAFAIVQAHHGDVNALKGHAAIVADIDAPAGPRPTLVQTRLVPGNYAAIDVAHNGQPPAATFTVTKSGSPAALPKPAATIKEKEYFFSGPATLHDGELVRFQNAGAVVHMTMAVKASSKANALKLMAQLKAGHDNAAHKLATGQAAFFETNSPGAVQQERITAAPGYWVLACFMTTKSGREHTTLGMLKLVRITG